MLISGRIVLKDANYLNTWNLPFWKETHHMHTYYIYTYLCSVYYKDLCITSSLKQKHILKRAFVCSCVIITLDNNNRFHGVAQYCSSAVKCSRAAQCMILRKLLSIRLLFDSWRPFCSVSALCDLFAHPIFYIKFGVNVPEKCYIPKHFHLLAEFTFLCGLCFCQKLNFNTN